MGENDESRIQLVWKRLTDQDPRSVKVQVLTATGVALASYLFFFVLTQGSGGTRYEGGNIKADGETHNAPSEFGGKRGENQPQDSLASDIGDVLRGTSLFGRRAKLAKFTQAEYTSFFKRLERLGAGISKHVQSDSGAKARFELRYRALEEVVAIVLKEDSSVFSTDRTLAKTWQEARNASVQVYRITYHPSANGYSAIPGIHRTWYTELVKDVYPSGEGPNEYPYLEHLEAIAVAKDRLFDQRLTVGEHEDVLAAGVFDRDTMKAITEAHRAMDAFHAALQSVAKTNAIVDDAIQLRQIAPHVQWGGTDLIASFQADYDIPMILRFAQSERIEQSGWISRAKFGLDPVASKELIPVDATGRVDFLRNPPIFLISDMANDFMTGGTRRKPRSYKDLRKEVASEPDWLKEEPPRGGPPHGKEKKTQENRGKKKRHPDGNRP